MITRAVVVGLMSGDKVCLLRRASNSDWEPNAWHMPGGTVEDDEEVQKAAVREIKEETGVLVKESDLIFLGVAIYRETKGRDVSVYFFATKKWTGQPEVCEPDKTQDIMWCDVAGMPKSVPAHAIRVFGDLSASHFLELRDGVVIYETKGVTYEG